MDNLTFIFQVVFTDGQSSFFEVLATNKKAAVNKLIDILNVEHVSHITL